MIIITIKEKYENSLKLYEDFWELYNNTNIKLYKSFIKKIENQEYSDRFIRKINNCLKFYSDNFDKNEYFGHIDYYGYGNHYMYLDVSKIGDEDNKLSFIFSKDYIKLKSATIDNKSIDLKEVEELNKSFKGTSIYESRFIL